MGVLSSADGPCGDAGPMVVVRTVRLWSLSAQVRMYASPEFTEPSARAGMPLVPVGQTARPFREREVNRWAATC